MTRVVLDKGTPGFYTNRQKINIGVNTAQTGVRGQRSDLQTLQPVPAVSGCTDLQQLQDSDEDVGVVVGQDAGHELVHVIQL